MPVVRYREYPALSDKLYDVYESGYCGPYPERSGVYEEKGCVGNVQHVGEVKNLENKGRENVLGMSGYKTTKY